MRDRNNGFCYDIIFKFYQQIIHLIYSSGCCIFNWKHCKVSCPLFDRLHGISKCPHIKAIAVFSKIILHCSLTISSFCTRENNSCMFCMQAVYLNKWKTAKCSGFHQLLILLLSTDRHQLFKYFPNSFLIKIRSCFCCYIL